MSNILVIDDRDRTIELCRRVMPEFTWNGPARSWEEAQQYLRRRRNQSELVLLDMHFDIPDGLFSYELSAAGIGQGRSLIAPLVVLL